MSYGIMLPFTRATGSLGIVAGTESTLDATASNILCLLVTNWGERPMMFRFGCNLIEFVFDQQKGDVLRQKIQDRILEQCRDWLPYVKLIELSVRFNEDDSSIQENAIGVSLTFSIIGKSAEQKTIERVIAFSR